MRILSKTHRIVNAIKKKSNKKPSSSKRNHVKSDYCKRNCHSTDECQIRFWDENHERPHHRRLAHSIQNNRIILHLQNHRTPHPPVLRMTRTYYMNKQTQTDNVTVIDNTCDE